MTDDRSIERAARSWLEIGPTEAPERAIEAAFLEIASTPQERDWHVPWRTPHMNKTTRLLAGAVVIAVVLVGGIVLLRPAASTGVGGPSPSIQATPSAMPAASSSGPAVQVGALTETFTSTRNGFTVDYPSGWTAKDATRAWVVGAVNSWGTGMNDEVSDATARFSGASQRLALGQTLDQWMTAYANGSDMATWPEVKIGSLVGKIDADGVPALGGTVIPGGVMYDAVVIAGSRPYNFNMDGNVDRATFEAFLKTVTFSPSDAIDLPPLTGTFTSPTYGYSIGTGDGWTSTPATKMWVGVDNSPPAVDEIAVVDTDTTVQGVSQALPEGTSFDEWLIPFHQNTLVHVPSGCDGGEPSTWPTIQIGDRMGRLEMLCNAAEALVEVGQRTYVFDWTHSSFTSERHLNLASWKELLKSVTFDPAAATK